jgi:pimeloyl-ACP methyl ester carboxylesterase
VKRYLSVVLSSTAALSLLIALVLGGVRPTLSAPGHGLMGNPQRLGATALVSVDPTGVQGSSDSSNTSISGSGRLVTSHSSAANLGVGDTNGLGDVFVSDQAGAASKRPIIIVPGMGSCYSLSCFLFDIDCDPDDWHWTPLPQGGTAQQLYKPLIDQLAAAGYTEQNHLLTVVFYDWRKPLAESADLLKDKIAEVKEQTGAAQVDLIGHSLGGLVARAYVQSNSDARDAAHLILLGSPNKGAAKTYPFWEGLYLYRLLPEEYTVLTTLIYYFVRTGGPLALNIFRHEIPSFQELLPTEDYLRLDDKDHGDPPKPERDMKQRNLYLAQLNANLATLFAHTDVSAFVGDHLDTPVRFYVRERPWWDWPYWDDGKPTWSRQDEFLEAKGDGTVPRASTELPSPAHVVPFYGVNHSELPMNQESIDTVFATLGIPKVTALQPRSDADETRQQLLVVALDGPAHATVTDPLGRSVGPAQASLPGGEYASHPSSLFKVLLIPTELEGTFEIDVEGHDAGTYQLAMLDTFNPPPEVVDDVTALWDTAQSRIEPATTVEFSLTYTRETSRTTSLIAVTPVIETPLWSGTTTVLGRALPGCLVQVRDVDTDAVLGSATAGTEGHFAVPLSEPLETWQQIYPLCDGKTGVPVTVGGPVSYLPLVARDSR